MFSNVHKLGKATMSGWAFKVTDYLNETELGTYDNSDQALARVESFLTSDPMARTFSRYEGDHWPSGAVWLGVIDDESGLVPLARVDIVTAPLPAVLTLAGS